MGMCNDLICYAPLPVRGAPTHGYQTESLGWAGLYVIDADGGLWCRPDIGSGWACLDAFSGAITFYQTWSMLNDDWVPSDIWVEFTAAFRAGIMTTVHVDHLIRGD